MDESITTYNEVIRLAKTGHSAEDIATRLGFSVEQIAAIIERSPSTSSE